MPFKPSYIFLDTSVYVHEAFRFFGNSLGKLVSMSHDDELRLIVPEIIQQEVTCRLRETAEQHVEKIRAALSSNIVGLMTANDRKRFGLDINLEKEVLVESIAETWELYRSRCNAVHVPLSAIDLADVVMSYFHAKPPFAKGRKRNEFPDAFAVSSILNFAHKESGRLIYIVSRDKGLLKAFENDPRFQCHKELSEVLDEYNRHTEGLSPAAHNLLENNIDWVAEAISDQLQQTPHLYASEYRGDVYVKSVEVDINEMNLVEICLSRATFDIEVTYHVEAEVREMVRVGLDDYDWDIIPRRFLGSTTAYIDLLSNSDFTELLEIANVEF